jgi:hypothetical protein
MNPELKFLRLDYWGGHLYYNDAPFPDTAASPCLLLNITDVLYVGEGDSDEEIEIYFREGYVKASAQDQNTQYVMLDLVASQVDNNFVIWLQEQIRNAFESDSAVYYPPTAPPVLFNTYNLTSINN